MKLISSVKQLDSIFRQSSKQVVLIFIHSSTCMTSSNAKNKMGDLEEKIDIPIYYCTVQEQGDVSRKIEEKTSVVHESPQAILIKDKKAIKDWDHENITEDNIFEAVIKE